MQVRITKRRSRAEPHTVTLRADDSTIALLLFYAREGIEAFLTQSRSEITTEVTQELLDKIEGAERVIDDPLARAYGAKIDL